MILAFVNTVVVVVVALLSLAVDVVFTFALVLLV